MKTQGQLDYEADVQKRPLYHDGGRRKQWHELGEIEQWSWNRPQFDYLPIDAQTGVVVVS